MAMQDRSKRNAITISVVLALMAACGGENQDTLLASAKDYLAKDDPKAAAIQIKNALQKNPNLAEARFLLGKALIQSGDPVGAEVELRKAMNSMYAPDEVVPLLAQAMLAAGQGKKVLNEFQKTELTSAEAKADLQTSFAVAYVVLGQIDKARASLDSALATKPDHARSVLMKARLLLGGGDVKGGVAMLDGILAKDARNFEAAKLKGDVLDVQKDTDGAIAAYRKAIETKSDFAPAHAALISLYMRLGKADEATAQLEAMKKVLPKNPQALLAEAELLYSKREFKPALEAVQNVLRVAPNHLRALVVAGAVQLQLNMYGQAEESLSRAVKAAPNAGLARRLLASLYLRTGQPAKALTTIEPMLGDGEKDAALLSLAGDIYMQNGNPQKAEEYFAGASAMDPKSAVKQTKVALSRLAEGKGDVAIGELERIAAADSSGTTADMALIVTAIRNKDFTKASKAIDGLEKKQPDSPLAHALRGAVLIAKGDAAGARRSFEKALTIKPSYFPAAASLAKLDLRDGKPEDARKRFESVLAADSHNVQAGMALAELKAKSGASSDEVAAQLSKTIQASPGEAGPRLALISLYLRNKEPKKAVTVAQEAAGVMADRVEVIDALSTALEAAGDTNQALAATGKLANLMPGSPQPYLRMAEIHVTAKNKDEAVRDLKKALDIKADLISAQRGLIMLYVDMKNYSEAQSVAAEVKRQRPKETIGYLFEGDIAAARKAWPEAVAAYRAGLKEVPAGELAVKLFSALQAGGNPSEAERFASGWLNDHPKDATFRFGMAENAAAQKDYPTAVRHYQTLLQTQPNNPLILNNLAWILGQLKDPKAMDYAERANRAAPNQPAIMETLGSMLAEKGDFGRALELLQKASDLAPKSGILRLSLAKVQVRAGKKGDARKNLEELSKLGDQFSGQAEVAKLLKEIGG